MSPLARSMDTEQIAVLPTGFFLMVIGQTMAKKTMLALLPPFYRSAYPCKRLPNVIKSSTSYSSITGIVPTSASPNLATLAQDLSPGVAAPVAASHAHSKGELLQFDLQWFQEHQYHAFRSSQVLISEVRLCRYAGGGRVEGAAQC